VLPDDAGNKKAAGKESLPGGKEGNAV